MRIIRHPVSVPENPRQEALQFLRSHGRKDNFWDHSALEILKNESIKLDAEQIVSLRQAVNGAKQERCRIIKQLLPQKHTVEDEYLLVSSSQRTALERAQEDLELINKDRMARLKKFLDVMCYYCESQKDLCAKILYAENIVFEQAEQLVQAAKQQDSGCGDIAKKLLNFVYYSDEAPLEAQQSLLEELEFLRLLALLELNLKHKKEGTLDVWARRALLVLSKPDFHLKINLNPSEMNDLIRIDWDCDCYNFSYPTTRKTLIATQMCQVSESEAALAEMQKEQPELVNSECKNTPEKSAITGLAVGVIAESGAGLGEKNNFFLYDFYKCHPEVAILSAIGLVVATTAAVLLFAFPTLFPAYCAAVFITEMGGGALLAVIPPLSFWFELQDRWKSTGNNPHLH